MITLTVQVDLESETINNEDMDPNKNLQNGKTLTLKNNKWIQI